MTPDSNQFLMNLRCGVAFAVESGALPEDFRAMIHALTAPPSPPNYERAEAERIAWASMDLNARLQELVDWIKAGSPDAARARIHALTRKVTMSDEDCADLAQELSGMFSGEITPVLQDLRDRYEERGKYAPDATEATHEP